MKISIITVCYNSEDTIRDTIESVLNQDYKNLEYILVDGNSNDGTIEIIKSYEKEAKEKGIIYKWISEPDKGIYDAMNKGIDMASGDWINFMNSGDSFINNKVLESFSEKIDNTEDIIYGDTIVKYDEDNLKKVKSKNLKYFYKGMPFCHQSTFISSKLMKAENYNLNYKLCADFDFFYRMYIKNKIFKYIPEEIALYDYNGVSTNSNKTFIEKREIVLSYNKNYNLYFKCQLIKKNLIFLLKFILPISLVRKIQMGKNGESI